MHFILKCTLEPDFMDREFERPITDDTMTSYMNAFIEDGIVRPLERPEHTTSLIIEILSWWAMDMRYISFEAAEVPYELAKAVVYSKKLRHETGCMMRKHHKNSAHKFRIKEYFGCSVSDDYLGAFCRGNRLAWVFRTTAHNDWCP